MTALFRIRHNEAMLGLQIIHTHASSADATPYVLLGRILTTLLSLKAAAVATGIAAYAAGLTKFFEASRPLWSRLPPEIDRWLPTVVMIVGSLPAKLTGVQTWGDFGLVVVAALGLAFPGRNRNPPAPAKEPVSVDVEVLP